MLGRNVKWVPNGALELGPMAFHPVRVMDTAHPLLVGCLTRHAHGQAKTVISPASSVYDTVDFDILVADTLNRICRIARVARLTSVRRARTSP